MKNAPDIEEYKKWYEEINPDNAASLYEQVVERIQFSKKNSRVGYYICFNGA